MNAPIVIFAFNRPDALKACVASLLTNAEAKDSDLIVFVDGPRADHEGEAQIVDAVRSLAGNISGFHSLETHFSKYNMGLGPSVISGVSNVIERYGRVIVIEDDLVLSRNFLAFMNKGLDFYEQREKVFSICGYSNKITPSRDYKFDAYFCPRSSSTGWATWKDRWESCDWELKDWTLVKQNARAFNRWGGSDCFGMLQNWKVGRNQSWAIRFCYNEFIQNKLSVFSVISHVRNIGFDGKGTNSQKWSRFKYEFDESESKEFVWPDNVASDKKIRRQALSYHSILARAYSRLMYLIHR